MERKSDMGKLEELFFERARSMNRPRVLELGTARSVPERSTRHDHWVPNAGEYIGVDIVPGVDVDVVADVHTMSDVLGTESFDVVITCSGFEHFKYPFRAAHEIMKVMKVEGVLFIQTHQTFILHAHPFDYFRYTKEGLEALFGTQMGFRVVEAGYEFPARIFSERDLDLFKLEAYLNVRLFGEKIAKTPEDFIYEL